MLQRSLVYSLSMVSALALALPATAQPTGATPTPAAGTATGTPTSAELEAARQHFRQGSKYYDLGRFLDAAHEYEAAFEARDDAAMLFNIGQAYRFAGENGKALGAYKAYLRRTPKTPRRTEIEARIADLQRLVAAQQQTLKAPPGGITNGSDDKSEESKVEEKKPAKLVEAPPPRREPIPESASNRTQRYAGIGVMAGGGALLVAGATLTGLAYSLQASQSRPGPNVAFDPNAPSRLRGEQISGGVLLGVGAGALVGGAIVYVLAQRNQHRERLVVAPLVGRDVAGLSVSGVLR